jgi:hypothetical protein
MSQIKKFVPDDFHEKKSEDSDFKETVLALVVPPPPPIDKESPLASTPEKEDGEEKPDALTNRYGLHAMVLVIRDVVEMFARFDLEIFSIDQNGGEGKPEIGPTKAMQKWMSEC